ncbi:MULTISPECIES: accessory gene regulator ArgB-like protein [Clostridium]|uniref:accessory gene regulator ArgB-like protein n=1 Tax=Clostridium TaxID=1485 RepID=UPI002903CE72|nr:accessory gene regulator B family protein [Clostridium sp.]MDU1279265.1 accessory gene regulator B family protein [Clostridium sp.]MDU3525656.1 accessory gene regulator B family protein [Clostridium sp.]MDU7088557.1 accessory gene regulator B family protein [Clostridium sp.]MDU7949785.1 accessory gene regulator B family protein [Clostridium sp.]
MNLELLCKNISYNLKKELNLDDDKRSIIEYGLYAVIHMLISILSVAIFGKIFGVMYEALIISFVEAILRKYSGGVHASTPFNCILIGIIVAVVPAYLIKSINLNINYIVFIGAILYITSLIIIYKLAPVDSPNKPIKKEQKIKKLKKSSLIVLSIYMIIVCYNIIMYYISDSQTFLIYSVCIYAGILWQVFTLTKYGHILVGILDSLLIKIMKMIGVEKK